MAHALTLPGSEMSTYYGGPAVKANGNAFLTPGREADSFHLMLDLDTVDMLMETDPDTFWQTPHYAGWPGLLVRYASADPARVLAMIERAHERALAKKPPKPRPKKTR
ncbi:hypothetical protein [Sphingomonas crocodyli]|uniref:hypothetical protein n=1 Tax=Sphingomonas crocodyli TaxID=1979270 RepID=UPI001F0C1099|nr:hypothetical protein [Sphingomonas crocodyli]